MEKNDILCLSFFVNGCQVVNIPTRNDKTLDLLFTNAPSPVNRVKGMPPIGKADHYIVYVEYGIKANRIKRASRKIYLYKRADMVGLKDHMAQFKDVYLSEDHSNMSVNDMWVKFKTGFVEAVVRFIPSKMTKTKYSVPWIDATIKRLVKRDILSFTFILANQRTLMSRLITSGSEHMFRRY